MLESVFGPTAMSMRSPRTASQEVTYEQWTKIDVIGDYVLLTHHACKMINVLPRSLVPEGLARLRSKMPG